MYPTINLVVFDKLVLNPVYLIYETKLAVLLEINGKKEWIPKSLLYLVKDNDNNRVYGWIPDWKFKQAWGSIEKFNTKDFMMSDIPKEVKRKFRQMIAGE